MREDLQYRLKKAARKVLLLRRIALSEDQFITRVSERSGPILAKARSKIGKLMQSFLMQFPEDQTTQKAENLLRGALVGLIDPSGSIQKQSLKSSVDTIKQAFKDLLPLAKQNNVEGTENLLRAFFALYGSAVYASMLQDPKAAQRALSNDRYRKKFYEWQEGLQQKLSELDTEISQIRLPEVTAPEKGKESDPNQGTETIIKEVRGIANQLQSHVAKLADLLLSKTEDLYPDDVELQDALDAAVNQLFPGRKKVVKDLNTDKSFWEDALHLQLPGMSYDVGQFLTKKHKKLLYHAYKAFLMTLRALGVSQYYADRPDLIMKNENSKKLLTQIEGIVRKRTKVVVDKLSTLDHLLDEDDEEEPIPLTQKKKTFKDVFEEQ